MNEQTKMFFSSRNSNLLRNNCIYILMRTLQSQNINEAPFRVLSLLSPRITFVYISNEIASKGESEKPKKHGNKRF